MFHKKFIFIRPFTFEGQTLQTNTELTVVNDKIYINGGQITPTYYHLFQDIVEDYLSGRDKSLIREITILYNKV